MYFGRQIIGDIRVGNKQTNADLIRAEAKEIGFNHTNMWWQKYLAEKYGRTITIQQIAAVLGRYEDRQIGDLKAVHEAARRLLLACRNDVGLAKRVLLEYAIG
jgi:hypothetical protein